jgi:pseudaminic acid synthase
MPVRFSDVPVREFQLEIPVPPYIEINGRKIGPGYPAYIIAEMSANHGQDFHSAVELIEAAKTCGADAIKLQTYTPDTLTIDCDNDYFRIHGTLWDGRTLFELYNEASMPWEWQPKLKKIANEMGLDLFSTPFDDSAVDFLESMGVPAHKVASFENGDIGLLRRIAKTGKPILASTGMATLAEIDELVRTIREAGGEQLALLKCTSAYPAPPEEMNLRTIPHLAEAFGVPTGLSDHTLGSVVPVAAVSLGACIVEKHFTFSREFTGPDSAFSLEPEEFKAMVEGVRIAEKSLGRIYYGLSPAETKSRGFRRSLFVIKDVRAGETFTTENVRSVRPAYGLHTRHLQEVLGRTATRDVPRGTPLAWELIGEKSAGVKDNPEWNLAVAAG